MQHILFLQIVVLRPSHFETRAFDLDKSHSKTQHGGLFTVCQSHWYTKG